jgi:hypothetical protein
VVGSRVNCELADQGNVSMCSSPREHETQLEMYKFVVIERVSVHGTAEELNICVLLTAQNPNGEQGGSNAIICD